MGLASLQNAIMIRLDLDKSMVWAVNMFKHQFKHGNKPNLVKGLGPHFLTLHKTILIKDFLEKYSPLVYPLVIPSEWDGNPIGDKEKDKEEDKEKEQDKERECEGKPKSAKGGPSRMPESIKQDWKRIAGE